MAQLCMKGEVQMVNDSHICLSLALLNRNEEKAFLFEDRVTIVILHLLLAFEMC